MSTEQHLVENPRYSCALGGALATATAMHRVVPILHGGPGCGLQVYNGQNYVAGYQGPAYIGGSAVPSTNTVEREVVFGGEQKLHALLRSAIELIDGDLYLVLTGCTAEIIGDDVAAVVAEYRREGRNVAYAETGGFKGNTLLGYELVWKGLLRQVVERRPRDPKLVNLFGVIPAQDIFWEGGLQEIARLLEALGLHVHTFYTNRQGVEEIKNSSAAALNIVLNPWLGADLAAQYEKAYRVPSLRFDGMPVGPTETSAFLRTVGEALGLSTEAVNAVIERETQAVYDQFAKASLAVTGFGFQHRVAIIGESGPALNLARFLSNDFGQILAAVAITDDPPEPVRERLAAALGSLEFGPIPEVIFTSEQSTIWEHIRQTEPTYIIGSSLDKDLAQELGVLHLSATFPVTDRVVLNRSYTGYRGCVTLVEDFIAQAITAL